MKQAFAILAYCLVLAGPAAAAEPLAVFETHEITGRDWPRTLVTYDLAKSAKPFKAGEAKLVDATTGAEVPFQLSKVQAEGGVVKGGRISFYAALPPGGHYRYELQPGKTMAAAKSPTATTAGGLLTLDNGTMALRLPTGTQAFDPPLALARDHAAVAKAGYEGLAKAGLAYGPIAGIRLGDGTWVGGSYFAFEPIEVVRQRQGSLKEVPADAWDRAAKAVPKVVRMTGGVTEQGPLFVEGRIRFEFDNGGHYELTARVLADDPAVRIDETMDTKATCPGEDPLYVAMALDGKAWKPDALFCLARGNTNKAPKLEAAVEKQGIKPAHASYPLPYDKPDATVTALVPHDPWSDRAQYFGVVSSDQLAAATTAPFLAIVPQHAGSWRGAHWVFPPKQPPLFQEIHTYDDGLVEMRWTIRNQPHPQNVLHTGEYDPDFGLTGMRRLWCLVGGPFQYHDTLFPLRSIEGYINLDSYAGWTLAWNDRTRAGVKLPPPAKPDQAEGPVKEFFIAMMGGGDTGPWFSHFRMAERMGWPKAVLDRLADPAVPAEQKGQLEAQVAALCSLLAEPDFNTRASTTHQGNPNMPINRFFALPFTAAAIPDHPLAKQWLDTTAAYLRYKGGMNIAPGGAWSELVTYYAASAPTLVHGGLVVQEKDRLDPGTRELVLGPVDFSLSLLPPRDPRLDIRLVPGFGHEGFLWFNHWLPAAALVKQTDPERAAVYAWAWQEQGKPGESQHCNGFAARCMPEGERAAQATPDMIRRRLTSACLPGFGAVLRNAGGDPQETFLGLRQGYFASHSDANQGDFVIYSKGAPLTLNSMYGYAIMQRASYKKLYDEFGWHSRVRFGDRKNFGGWPGGGPVSGIHRHFFSDSVDYLKGLGDYGPVPEGTLVSEDIRERWTRQVLFLKGKTPASPNYFVFRDSFRPPAEGTPEPTWWTQRVLGKKEQVATSSTGFEFTSEFGGVKMDTRFLQPASVALEVRDATEPGGFGAMGMGGSQGLGKDKPPAKDETIAVVSAGPIAAGQDVLVAIYPRGKDEQAATFATLADGVAKITTPEGTDYVFLNPAGLAFKEGAVAFEGRAGAIRVRGDTVDFVVAEGAGKAAYKGFTFTAGKPARKTVAMADVAKEGVAEVPADPVSITFALDAAAGAIEDIAPGVKRQQSGDVTRYAFDSAEPIAFAKDGVTFTGRRGGIVADAQAGTVRLVMLDGERIGHREAVAQECSGPYDLTFHADRVSGVSEGPARLLQVRMPAGIVALPALAIGGVRYAPGTHGDLAIIPLPDGRGVFTLENLPQPPVFTAGNDKRCPSPHLGRSAAGGRP